MTVRVGILGVGVMGADHARTLATEVSGATVQAIYDADASRAAEVASRTGAERIGSDPTGVINDPTVDAVLIASPDATHRDFTLAALAAGKPALCEKPLAPTARECLELAAAEARAGRRLVQVGYMRRFDPAYAEMKARLSSGEIGKPLMFHCSHRNVTAPPWFDANMAISNSAVHEFDVARWLLDAELTSVQVFRPRTATPGAPGSPVLLVLETSAGQLVDIEVFNNAGYGYDVRGELVCERGMVALRSPAGGELSLNLVQGVAYPADWRPRFADAYRLQLQAWIRSIETGIAAGAGAWDGYAASLVAEAGLKSLVAGAAVRIEMDARPLLFD